MRVNGSNLTGFRPFVQRVFGKLSEVVRLFSKVEVFIIISEGNRK